MPPFSFYVTEMVGFPPPFFKRMFFFFAWSAASGTTSGLAVWVVGSSKWAENLLGRPGTRASPVDGEGHPSIHR